MVRFVALVASALMFSASSGMVADVAATATEAAAGETVAVAVAVANEGQRPPDISARSWVVADLDSGNILAANDRHKRFSPASTQKMLTALAVLPRLKKKDHYRAKDADATIEGTAVGLQPGRAYTHDQLFHAMFLPSANDAANALARSNGGVDVTVRQMNALARKLGAKDTVAANPNGLEPDNGEKQYSSAYDLALIARAGMQRRDFRSYVRQRSYRFPSGRSSYVVSNTNRLLGEYRGMVGIKTGYTSKALNTFVAAAERNGRRVLVTVLGMGGDTEWNVSTLLDWGFDAVGKQKPIGYLVSPEDVAAREQPYRVRFAILQ